MRCFFRTRSRATWRPLRVNPLGHRHLPGSRWGAGRSGSEPGKQGMGSKKWRKTWGKSGENPSKHGENLGKSIKTWGKHGENPSKHGENLGKSIKTWGKHWENPIVLVGASHVLVIFGDVIRVASTPTDDR